VARLIASLAGLAEARVRRVARRARWRAALIGLAALLGLMALGFALIAATVALAEAIGPVRALLVMAGIALFGLAIVLIVLAAEARDERRRAARRETLDRELARAALLAAVPSRPSRGMAGIALVVLGAVLVLRRRD
jgi:hypothetical protein